MTVELVAYTPNADGVCGRAASICTRSKDPRKALKAAIASGHESVMEHASYTFLIDGISRVTLAQLTRHRIASFSVESQRYAGIGSDMIFPESVKGQYELMDEMVALNDRARVLYGRMVANGVAPEDARYIMPEGTTTRLMMTMNARELRHFFDLRCCQKAQWEIRNVADRMLELCKGVSPILFSDAGKPCKTGHGCPEKKPCEGVIL